QFSQQEPPAQPPRPRQGNRLGIDPVAYQSAQRQHAAAPNGDTLEGPLLTALLQGVGLDDLQPQPHFDEQQIRLAGRLLSLFSQGTVALLSSRSILKRGVKAEMTMILDEANNPFKLLPSGKTVLMQMFGSQMPGFMPPEQAVRDALIDLQAHQLGMIAGIRAIIAAMLQSFNPERLEEEARKEGVAPRLSLPANRKAALWDYFVKNYQQTSGEIEDDFHTLFGEAFLHAYDVEVNQYKDSQTKPDA
ncbi:type VI secretion system-associated FHA domain protein TagH, partial [Serratia marcescens]